MLGNEYSETVGQKGSYLSRSRHSSTGGWTGSVTLLVSGRGFCLCSASTLAVAWMRRGRRTTWRSYVRRIGAFAHVTTWTCLCKRSLLIAGVTSQCWTVGVVMANVSLVVRAISSVDMLDLQHIRGWWCPEPGRHNALQILLRWRSIEAVDLKHDVHAHLAKAKGEERIPCTRNTYFGGVETFAQTSRLLQECGHSCCCLMRSGC